MSTPYQYPTDITDARWQQLRPLLPARRWRRGGPGRPPRDLRLVLNGNHTPFSTAQNKGNSAQGQPVLVRWPLTIWRRSRGGRPGPFGCHVKSA